MRATAKSVVAGQTMAAVALLVGIKLATGWATRSVSVLSEAIESGIDLLAAAVTYFSVRAAEAPADRDHPYGHGKAEHLAAVTQAVLIVLAGAYVVAQAIPRLREGSVPVRLDLAVAVMLLSAGTSWSLARRLQRIAREGDSPALAADSQHLMVDAATSAAVVAGLLLVAITGQGWIDGLVGLAVAGAIFRTGWRLISEAVGDLMDRGLPEAEIARLQEILNADPRIVGYHRVRARRAGSQRHIDLHLLLDPELSLRVAHDLAEEIEDRIRAAFPGVVVMTHVEPATEEELAVDAAEPGIWKGHRAR